MLYMRTLKRRKEEPQLIQSYTTTAMSADINRSRKKITGYYTQIYATKTFNPEGSISLTKVSLKKWEAV